MNTTTKTNSRNQSTKRNQYNGNGTKRGYSSRNRAPQYFVIDAKTNTKISINDKENNIIQSWLELKAQESALKEQMEAMKQAVVDVVSEKGGNVKYRGFEITTKVRRSYQFSAEVNDLETELKWLKADEIKNEIADCTRQTEFVEVRTIEK